METHKTRLPAGEPEIQTRTEHSRSLEDAEKYKALEVLRQIGLLIPVADLKTVHGRTRYPDETEPWAVDPTFENGGNDSGNMNANAVPTLYTGEASLAAEFAGLRTMQTTSRLYGEELNQKAQTLGYDNWEQMVFRVPAEETNAIRQRLADEKGVRTELHEITSPDSDAMVIDCMFDAQQLDANDTRAYQAALQTLAVPVTEGAPLEFGQKDTFEEALQRLGQKKEMLYADGVLTELARDAPQAADAIQHLGAAINARRMVQVPENLVKLTLGLLGKGSDADMEVPYRDDSAHLSNEYIRRWLREAHIVGAKTTVDSASVGRKIDSVVFFDLDKTVTEQQAAERSAHIRRRFGGIVTEMSEVQLRSDVRLAALLDDAYVKPHALVDAARELPGYEAIFDADAGNWEGYTLAEHTETVLRNFDENYADSMPVELLKPMRLAILAHDLGKPEAARDGRKHDQQTYSARQAEQFMETLGVDANLRTVIQGMIGDGEELAFRTLIRKEAGAKDKLIEFAHQTVRKAYGNDAATTERVQAVLLMCSTLQACDGGAYTSMAVTHSRNGKGRYRNAPSFDGSFSKNRGFDGRVQRRV